MSEKSPAPSSRSDVRQVYEARRKQFEGQRDTLVRRGHFISTLRLLTFLVAAGTLVFGFWGLRLASPISVVGGFLSSFVFLVLVVWHDRVLRARDRAEIMVRINAEAILRMERRWDELPSIAPPVDLASDPVARDLDIFPTESGRASVLQLVGTANTPQGRDTLARWLLLGSDPETIARRQHAGAELRKTLDFRQELDLRGRLLGVNPPDPQKFFEWAEGESWLHQRPWLIWLSRLLGFVGISATTLRIIGVVPTGWLIIILFCNLLFAFAFSKWIMSNYDTISGRERAAKHYSGLFEILDGKKFESDELQRLIGLLESTGKTVSQHMRQLERLGGLADTRFTPLFHIPLVAITLWDFHVLWGFERWQRSAGRQVRVWFQTLGEIEALSALSTLHYDHPDWTYPSVEAGAEIIVIAKKIGHPLLPPGDCVANDVQVGPKGSFLLVTGSNMSGKSTLLRSIGTNAVLAQAGAPVCAQRFLMPPVVLGTSFRVHDSLEAGVSFFMAELRRLKAIVDLARELHDATAEKGKSDRHLLFLLDEILQGTNVYERQVAVRRVILHLLRYEAIGAISTHDLTLAEADELAEACEACHFTESYEKNDKGPRMQFDYVLRPGVSSTVNALKLLEIVGLGEERTSHIPLPKKGTPVRKP